MARTASDVLAVVLMMRECGVRDYMRVVPLFETLDDLTNAPATMRTLLGSEWYLQHIITCHGGVQECMIGKLVGLNVATCGGGFRVHGLRFFGAA